MWSNAAARWPISSLRRTPECTFFAPAATASAAAASCSTGRATERASQPATRPPEHDEHDGEPDDLRDLLGRLRVELLEPGLQADRPPGAVAHDDRDDDLDRGAAVRPHDLVDDRLQRTAAKSGRTVPSCSREASATMRPVLSTTTRDVHVVIERREHGDQVRERAGVLMAEQVGDRGGRDVRGRDRAVDQLARARGGPGCRSGRRRAA
jgi:hypothetical protein